MYGAKPSTAGGMAGTHSFQHDWDNAPVGQRRSQSPATAVDGRRSPQRAVTTMVALRARGISRSIIWTERGYLGGPAWAVK